MIFLTENKSVERIEQIRLLYEAAFHKAGHGYTYRDPGVPLFSDNDARRYRRLHSAYPRCRPASVH